MYHDVNEVTLGDKERDCVGKLQLPTLAWLDAAKGVEHCATLKVAPRGNQIRRRSSTAGYSNILTTFSTRSSLVAET